jgi:hypothetical protein
MGNVQTINFSVNHETPAMWGGMVMSEFFGDIVPVASIPGMVLPPFATSPSIISNFPWSHFKLMEESTVDAVQALVLLQGRTNVSSEKAVTASGTVDVERYGGLLFAPGVVTVRGAGHHHDGKYTVSGVTSDITPEHFKQEFTLNREGMGSTVSMVSPVGS